MAWEGAGIDGERAISCPKGTETNKKLIIQVRKYDLPLLSRLYILKSLILATKSMKCLKFASGRFIILGTRTNTERKEPID